MTAGYAHRFRANMRILAMRGLIDVLDAEFSDDIECAADGRPGQRLDRVSGGVARILGRIGQQAIPDDALAATLRKCT